MEKFRKELEQLINKHSIENHCDMPDYMLAELLCKLIIIIGMSSKANLAWHGCDSVCHSKKGNINDTVIEKQIEEKN